MNNNPVSYLKTDDNRILNEAQIKWVKKMNECLEVCTRSDGCKLSFNTHTICKSNSLDSYNKLIKHFE